MLSAVDLASELYRRQGYLILCDRNPIPVGTIVTDAKIKTSTSDDRMVPVRVVAESNREEIMEQIRVAAEIEPHAEDITLPDHFRFFYRVEALD